MSDIALLMGPIGFRDFEVPANIGFGGEQRIAVHKLLGGTRVIDTLGRDDADITFSGIFSGADATSRARAIDALRAEGLPLPLTWDVFFYTVIIRSFEADYRSGWWIPYRVTCTVLRDEAGALIDAGISFATSALSDIASAAGQALAGGLDLSSTQALTVDPDATTPGSTAFTRTQSGLRSARLALDERIGSVENNLSLGAGQLASASTAQEGISALDNAVDGAHQLGALTTARGYLGRAVLNFSNVGA